MVSVVNSFRLKILVGFSSLMIIQHTECDGAQAQRAYSKQ
jgi:hypothetical protein